MPLGTHFFNAPFCKCSMNYIISWIFLILGYSFVSSIILANPLDLKYGDNEKIIQGILIMGGCFLITIISRCMCYKKEEEERYILTGDNPYYTERV
tara:strand:+ start:1729 stop:2016 length:288 start_codon:yes stop_codon:yes gene_type:complete